MDDERYEEMWAMKAIYGSDFQLRGEETRTYGDAVRGHGGRKKKKRKGGRGGGGGSYLRYDVFVSPFAGEDERNWVSVVASFCMGAKYPETEAARVSIKRREGGARGYYGPSESRILELHQLATQMAAELVGRVYVYDILCALRDKLLDWNVPPLALQDSALSQQRESVEQAAQLEKQRRKEEREELDRIRDAAKQRAVQQVRLKELEAQATMERNSRKQKAMIARGVDTVGEWSVDSDHRPDLYDDIDLVLNDFHNMRLPPTPAREKHLTSVARTGSKVFKLKSSDSRSKPQRQQRKKTSSKITTSKIVLHRKGRRKDGWDTTDYSRWTKREEKPLGSHSDEEEDDDDSEDDDDDDNIVADTDAVHHRSSKSAPIVAPRPLDIVAPSSSGGISSGDESSSSSASSSSRTSAAPSSSSASTASPSSSHESDFQSISHSALSVSPPDLWPIWPNRPGNTMQKPVHKSNTAEGVAFGSRFQLDFEVLAKLGEGGFGSVVKARNKLDGRVYAVKRVTLYEKEHVASVVREVVTLSRLMHPNIVRYYQAWLEPPNANGDVDVFTEFPEEKAEDGDTTQYNATVFNTNTTVRGDSGFTSGSGRPQREVAAFLYIQMEYCRSTLREFIDYADDSRHDLWAIFRQIVEGLNYIHSRGIVHRDLKPNNIFFSTSGDIKIGDFGLAKNIQHVEEWADDDGKGGNSKTDAYDPASLHSGGPGVMSMELSIGVGTAQYRAPEMEEKGRRLYSDKLDIYSLGIIAWELWHGPCVTHMERVDLISELRERSCPDRSFEKLNPQQSKLVRALLQKEPETRPSALELLEGDLLPARVEDEYTRAVLRHLAAPGSRLRAQALEILFGPDTVSTEANTLVDETTLPMLLSESPNFYDFNLSSSGPSGSYHSSSNLLLSKSKSRRVDASQGQVHEHLVEEARNVFRAHGARPTTCPPITPETSLTIAAASMGRGGRRPGAGSRVYLSRTGSRMVLTDDSRTFFARSVVGTKFVQKRYEIGRVWEAPQASSAATSTSSYGSSVATPTRKKLTHIGLRPVSPQNMAVEIEQAPQCVSFADFDIVLPYQSHSARSEVIKAALEVMAAFPLAERAHVRLGHSVLATAALHACCTVDSKLGITTLKRSQLDRAENALSWLPYVGWNCTRRALLEEAGLSTTIVDKLKQFVILKGPPATVLRHYCALYGTARPVGTCIVEGLVSYEKMVARRKDNNTSNSGEGKEVKEDTEMRRSPFVHENIAQSMNELVALLISLEAMQVATDEVVVLDPLLFRPGQAGRGRLSTDGSRRKQLVPDLLYLDDFVFEIFIRRAREARGSNVTTECIGWGGSWDNLLNEHARLLSRISGRNCATEASACGVSINLEKVLQLVMRSGNSDMDWASSCDVFVCSNGLGPSSIHERSSLAAQLWSIGVRADFSYNESASAREQVESAMERGAKWLVSMRHQRNDSDPQPQPTQPLIRLKSLGNNRVEEDIPLCEITKRFAFLKREK